MGVLEEGDPPQTVPRDSFDLVPVPEMETQMRMLCLSEGHLVHYSPLAPSPNPISTLALALVALSLAPIALTLASPSH